MLSVSLKHIFWSCNKILVRNLRSRSRKFDEFGPNPGLDKRLQASNKEGIQFEDDDAEEFIDQSESEISNVIKSHNKNIQSNITNKYELRRKIVKDKYFKEDMPNLLTWSEKEQIRHLATTEPDEWTPEKISESFPVTASVVKKLLKYPWKPATEERIMRHDSSSIRNWKELKEGTLNIPDNLRNHFLKFLNRNIPPLNKKSMKIDITQDSTKMGEYESIITRCAAKESTDKQSDNKNFELCDKFASSKNIPHKDKKLVTLDELRDKIKKRVESGNSVDVPDQIMLDTIRDDTSKIPPMISEVRHHSELQNNEVNELAQYKSEDNNVLKVDTSYPERIRIPKKVYKKDATYKLNDCFYDHDGRFLYRVIGVSN